MKKIYTAIFLSIVSAGGVFGQLTQSNNAPANGDTWSTLQCDTAGINAGAAGTGKTWNYSNIVVNNGAQVNYNAANVSGMSTYPAANVSVTATNTESAFYNSSVNSLKYYGGKRNSQGNSFTLGYNSPAVAAFYPMTMNTPSSAAVAGTVDVFANNVTASGSFAGNSSVIADASGTMILPGASQTFTDVTRTLFTQNISFTVTVPIFGAVNGTMTELTYNYYQSGIKAPLFTISNFTVLLPSPFPTTVEKRVTRNKDAVGTGTTTTTVSVTYVEPQQAEIKLYPNPANQAVTLRANSDNWQTVEIFDLTGRLVEKKMLADGKVTINVSDYQEGLYIYSLTGSKDQRSYSGKIAVKH